MKPLMALAVVALLGPLGCTTNGTPASETGVAPLFDVSSKETVDSAIRDRRRFDVPGPDKQQLLKDIVSGDSPSNDAATPDLSPDNSSPPDFSCANGATVPCYSGPSGTESVGVCKAGERTCAGAQWGVCSGQTMPSPEGCDGKDNDCNGKVDDSVWPQTCYGGPSTTSGIGLCKPGAQTCTNGTWGSCIGAVTPSFEICDNKDNDCDGKVDNCSQGTCLGGQCRITNCALSKFGSHSYGVCATKKTWLDARQYCGSHGGYLASVCTSNEDNYLRTQISTTTWFGLNDLATEGSMKWDSGELYFKWPCIYENWAPGEPNNQFGNEDCGQYYDTTFINKEWNDADCSQLLPFVCEWDS